MLYKDKYLCTFLVLNNKLIIAYSRKTQVKALVSANSDKQTRVSNKSNPLTSLRYTYHNFYNYTKIIILYTASIK